jgi:hypothetical protein
MNETISEMELVAELVIELSASAMAAQNEVNRIAERIEELARRAGDIAVAKEDEEDKRQMIDSFKTSAAELRCRTLTVRKVSNARELSDYVRDSMTRNLGIAMSTEEFITGSGEKKLSMLIGMIEATANNIGGCLALGDMLGPDSADQSRELRNALATASMLALTVQESVGRVARVEEQKGTLALVEAIGKCAELVR